MARYRCPRCHEITYRPELYAFCGICSAPLTGANLDVQAEDRSSLDDGAASEEVPRPAHPVSATEVAASEAAATAAP